MHQGENFGGGKELRVTENVHSRGSYSGLGFQPYHKNVGRGGEGNPVFRSKRGYKTRVKNMQAESPN